MTHIAGARCEIAAAMCFNVFPFSLFVDVSDLSEILDDVAGKQIRSTTHINGRLILHPDDDDNQVFVLAIDRCPKYDFIGEIQAGMGKRPEFWPGPYDNRPAFFVPRNAEGFVHYV